METKYTKEYFIDKFSKLKDKDIGSGSLFNKCALFYCGVKKEKTKSIHTEESKALCLLFGGDESLKNVWEVNDGVGEFSIYAPTPRQRILKRLSEI